MAKATVDSLTWTVWLTRMSCRRLYKDRRNPLDVSDINNDPEGAGHVFHTNRLTNVLDPRYVWDVPAGAQNWTIGDIGDDKPAPQMNARDAPRCEHTFDASCADLTMMHCNAVSLCSSMSDCFNIHEQMFCSLVVCSC